MHLNLNIKYKLFFILLAKFEGVYSDPYVCSFVRPSITPSPSLIRYSSKTAEQNFMKLSGTIHYMVPNCTSYFKFLSAWFWGFPEQNMDFAITTYGGPISNPLLLLDRWTELWNFQELFTTWCHTAPPILNFYLHDFGVSLSKTWTLPLQHMGGPISNPLLL